MIVIQRKSDLYFKKLKHSDKQGNPLSSSFENLVKTFCVDMEGNI